MRVCKGSGVFGRIFGEPSRRLHLLLVPSLGKNEPSNTLLKTTGEKANWQLPPRLQNWGKGFSISELSFEAEIRVKGEVLLD